VLWTAVAFLFLWDFSPSFGVPLDYFLVDRLGVSKMFLGTLDSIDAVGAILGAFLYGKCCQGVSIRKLLYVSVAIGAASTFSFWGLVGFKTAAALTFINGVVAMVANLATFDLAARSCPDRAEGTFFAALMSVANLGAAGSGFVGGWLYERIGLSPLIMVSGLATLACALIIPLIRLDGKEAQAAQGRT
jgi:predicted MFS family arabinose efflux permease